MPHIEVREVSLTYDTPAGRVAGVQAASFDIEQSEFFCLVGPSGCGKSTLLNLIADSSTRPAAKSASAAKKSTATGSTAGSCSRISRSCSRGAPRSGT